MVLVNYIMKHNVSKVLLLALMFLLLASFSPATAFSNSQGDDATTGTKRAQSDDNSTITDDDDEHELDEHRDDDGTVWIETDIMTVTLSPEMPTYQYWYATDNNGSLARFMISFRMIVEFEDSNGDGVFQANETIAFAPLDAFEWSLQTGTITDSLDQVVEVFASYTKGGLSGEWEDGWFEDWMPELGDDEGDDNSTLLASDGESDYNFTRFSEMTLRFYGHIYTTDFEGNVTDDFGFQSNYTVAGGSELKVDIEIGNFPFLSNTSKIAVLNYMREDVASTDDSDYFFRLHEDDGDDEIESEDISDDHGTMFEDKDDDHDGEDDSIQQLSFVDDATNITRGFYTWLDNALMTYLNGSQVAVDVGASYWTDGNGLLLFLVYPNFDGGSILHDPSMRLLEGGAPTGGTSGILGLPIETIALIGVAAAIIVVAGLAIKRR